MTPDNLSNQAYALLDSVLVGEYSIPTRCRGLLLLLSEDLPDASATIYELTNHEADELLLLATTWEERKGFAQASQGFLAAGVAPSGHRVLAWGYRDGGDLILKDWAVWLGQKRLPVSTATRAANFAHKTVEGLMQHGIIHSLQAPLHFGWQEDALASLHFCALSALEANLHFPEADVESLLKARLHCRGFGFAQRDERLIWLIVENTVDGFGLIAFGYQQPEGSANFNRVAQA